MANSLHQVHPLGPRCGSCTPLSVWGKNKGKRQVTHKAHSSLAHSHTRTLTHTHTHTHTRTHFVDLLMVQEGHRLPEACHLSASACTVWLPRRSNVGSQRCFSEVLPCGPDSARCSHHALLTPKPGLLLQLAHSRESAPGPRPQSVLIPSGARAITLACQALHVGCSPGISPSGCLDAARKHS